MSDHEPEPISAVRRRARIGRLRQLARRLGFVGHLEYRHVYSRSGGAQYCIGPSEAEDLLVVYAEAFERDANPQDFALEAIIAHECGHQALVRNPRLAAILAKLGQEFEEVLASLIGAILVEHLHSGSFETLVWKASAELTDLGIPSDSCVDFVERLDQLLRHFL